MGLIGADPACRWIMPYSRQFKFVFLATCPFCPRWLACWAINSWMAALYAKCGIAFMGPAPGSDHSFTGQCNDAFFQLAKLVFACPAVSSWDRMPSIATYDQGHCAGMPG